MPQTGPFTLDNLEFRTPISEYQRQNGTMIHLLVSAPWQRRFKSLWEFVQAGSSMQSGFQVTPVSGNKLLTSVDRVPVIQLITGAPTMTLPLTAAVGDTYFIVYVDAGTMVIAGNINGNPAGLNLMQYKSAELMCFDIAGFPHWVIIGGIPT